MQVRSFLKNYNRIDSRISVNNNLILGWKETAMMFLGASESDKRNREICIAEAKKIKAESDQLMKDSEELKTAIQSLPPLQQQVLDMFVIKGFKATVCSEILGCSLNQLYSLKNKAVQELERMMQDETHSDL